MNRKEPVLLPTDPLPPHDLPEGAALDARIHHGLRWSFMRQAVTGLVGTVGALAYTHLLQPEDLGAVTLAFLVYNGLFLLVEAPIRDAVVYYRNREDAYSSAAFWLLLGFSTLAVVLVLSLAGLLGHFYNSAQATALARGMVLAFFFQALAVVPAAMLLKQFRFAVHESLQTIFNLGLLAGWVALAATGWGAWSLVLPQVAGGMFWAATTWIAARFRPTLRPGWDAYRGIVRFSRSLLGSKLLVYLKNNLDQAAVGILGEGPLGWYTLGEVQSSFAVLAVGQPVAQIALPAMAAVQTQRDRVRCIYLDMLRLAATLSTPMQIGAIVLADLGFWLFFGEQWLGAVPVFCAYLTFRLVHTLQVIGDSATSALGRPDVRLVLELAQLPFFAVGLWFGLRVWGGIAGVAWSLAIVRLVAGLVYLAATMRLARMAAGEVYRYLLPSSLAGVVMGLVVYGVRRAGVVHALLAPASDTMLAGLAELLALALVGIVVYFGLLFALDRSGLGQVVVLAARILLPAPLRTRLANLGLSGVAVLEKDRYI